MLVKAVVDTNVWVSGLLNSAGAPRQIAERFEADLFVLVCSNLTRIAVLALLCLASASAAGANPSSTNLTSTKAKPVQGSAPAKPAIDSAPKAAQPLSPQDLQFGEKQVQKMLVDRPQMANILLKNEPIWPWAVRQFAGEAANERIYWNSSALTEKGFEYDSDHCSPEPREPGYIRLRKTDKYGQPMAPNRLLAAFVFECFNLRGTREFDMAYEQALKGLLSRDRFIEQNTKIEFAATRKTADFYRTVYLPLAKKRRYALDPFYWEGESPTTYSEWRAQYTDHSAYPWSYWGKHYDNAIVPYRKAVQKHKAANKH